MILEDSTGLSIADTQDPNYVEIKMRWLLKGHDNNDVMLVGTWWLKQKTMSITKLR